MLADAETLIRRTVESVADDLANRIERLTGRMLTDAELDKLATAIEDDGIRAAVEGLYRG